MLRERFNIIVLMSYVLVYIVVLYINKIGSIRSGLTMHKRIDGYQKFVKMYYILKVKYSRVLK